ncbi:hypothetical protein, partial [Streptosporangium sp. NPDC050280]|uniref:hypothetical protein n=1 Tax=Streptosporangium sp. NPDC050280 TaxID=3154934 RepID=UPI00343EB373
MTRITGATMAQAYQCLPSASRRAPGGRPRLVDELVQGIPHQVEPARLAHRAGHVHHEGEVR